ncbi:hypothetical protein PAHAL_5G443600 [Panicum hallii]|uniref:Uncharacterized protein n=1 Tax=Panicum hallii TaxID=206008 RepID=A0A2T8INC0_9POAL|nr:hypothetical protein PAHAL_5G443600 [Panicum hallii]
MGSIVKDTDKRCVHHGWEEHGWSSIFIFMFIFNKIEIYLYTPSVHLKRDEGSIPHGKALFIFLLLVF